MSTDIKFNSIVAMCAKSNGIGKNNQLPWSLKEDHEYYKRVVATTRHSNKINAVLLGRLSWESLPLEERPFKNCLNIIISRTMNESNIECGERTHDSLIFVSRSLDEALDLIKSKFQHRIETVWCLGGSSLYAESFRANDFNQLFLTRVFGEELSCDVFIQPKNFLDQFEKLENADLVEETKLYECDYNLLKKDPLCGLEYIFEVYRKKNPQLI